MLLGAVLRFTGLDWGISSLRDFRLDGRELSIQGAGFHPDANFLTVAAESLRRSVHPHHVVGGEVKLYSVFGPVFMYLFWIVGKVVSVFGGFSLFNLEGVRDANWTRLVGRGLSAGAGTLSVFLTYRLGWRCYGRPAGLAAAFLLAVTPLSIQSSHFCTVDVLLSLWMVLAFFAILRVLETGRLKDYLVSGGLIGLGCATKLHALQVFVPLGAAHLIRAFGPPAGDDARAAGRGDRGGEKARAFVSRLRPLAIAVTDLKIYLALGASVLAFAVLVPSSVLRFRDYFDPSNMLTAINAIRVNTGEVMMRGSNHFVGTRPYLYYITNLFPAAFGIPLEVTIFAAIGWAAYRRGRADAVLLSLVVFYFLATGRFQGKYIRYFVMWMPFAAVLSGRFLVDVCKSAWRPLRVPGTALSLVVGVYTSAYGAAVAGVYRQPDVRVEVAKWVAKNVPAGSAVVLERGHNGMRELLSKRDFGLVTLDMDGLLWVPRSKSLLKSEYYRSALYQVYLRRADYVVMSDDRLAARGRLPLATLYYDALMDGGYGYSLEREFQVRPNLFGIPFDDSDSDVTWRQFEHPRILIFRNRGQAPASDPSYRLELPLTTPEMGYKMLMMSMRFKDTLMLYGCLLKEVRERVIPEELETAVDFLSGRPDLLERLGDPRFAVQEEDGWGIDLPRFTAEVAAEKAGK